MGNTVPDLPDGELEPLEQLCLAEHRHIVRQAINNLSEQTREVILLKCRDKLSFPEIGRQLGTSADAARGLYRRGQKKLTHILQLLQQT